MNISKEFEELYPGIKAINGANIKAKLLPNSIEAVIATAEIGKL